MKVETITSIPPYLALSMDGFTSAFFCNFWEPVKLDVLAAVNVILGLRHHFFTLLTQS